jgi:hypothetical protein
MQKKNQKNFSIEPISANPRIVFTLCKRCPLRYMNLRQGFSHQFKSKCQISNFFMKKFKYLDLLKYLFIKCTVTSSSYQHNATVTSGVLYCYFLLYFQIYCNISLSYTFKSTYIIILRIISTKDK